MKSIFLILLVTFATPVVSDEIRDIIHDPAVSRRCKALLSERTEKIKVQQKLNSLMLRNKKLLQKTKPNQKTVITRLELNGIQVKNNLR